MRDGLGVDYVTGLPRVQGRSRWVWADVTGSCVYGPCMNAGFLGMVSAMSGQDIERLDPERRRRRIQLLAELAEARALRNRVAPRRARHERQRDFITNRRRMA